MESTDTLTTSNSSQWTIQTLPTEILDLIMLWGARIEANQKNNFLPRRLLCKEFDKAIRPLIFKGIQLETTMFMRTSTAFQMQYLAPVAHICEAMYLDLMVVRDEEEANSLVDTFQHPHPMQNLSDLFRQHSMGEHTFDETDFRSKLATVLEATPNLKRMRINLPVQVMGPSNTTSTLLLATTLSVLATNRPEEHKPLEALVIDHITEMTIRRICHNHMDLTNCLAIFSSLKHLVFSLTRTFTMNVDSGTFAANFWYLLRQASKLESLCLIGWNNRSDHDMTRPRVVAVPRRHLDMWQFECLPYHLDGSSAFKNLRSLELKQLSIEAPALMNIISEASQSLKELYLNLVYLKINTKAQQDLGLSTSLWIGHPIDSKSEEISKAEIPWIAAALRNMPGLKLDILRATELSYDDFAPDEYDTDYDLGPADRPCEYFDQLFVDTVMGERDPITLRSLTNYLDESKHAWDADTYQKTVSNSTSGYKTSIDGLFLSHNDGATRQLGAFIETADRNMRVMSDWVNNARRVAIDEPTGTLVVPIGGDVDGAGGVPDLDT